MEIDPHAELSGVTLVTVIHDEFDEAKHTANTLKLGLPIVLSGLKTLQKQVQRLLVNNSVNRENGIGCKIPVQRRTLPLAAKVLPLI